MSSVPLYSASQLVQQTAINADGQVFTEGGSRCKSWRRSTGHVGVGGGLIGVLGSAPASSSVCACWKSKRTRALTNARFSAYCLCCAPTHRKQARARPTNRKGRTSKKRRLRRRGGEAGFASGESVSISLFTHRSQQLLLWRLQDVLYRS